MKALLFTAAAMLTAVSFVPGAILLNEVHLNPPNPDADFEFMELRSTTGGVESCANLWVVIINNDRNDPDYPVGNPLRLQNLGEIREAWSLNDFSTGPNGLLLLGNGYAGVPRGGAWSGAIDANTAVGDPVGMGSSDIASNDGLTILLVSGFSGVRNEATGKWPDVDVNNNGIFDWSEVPIPAGANFTAAPWTAIVDSIGTRDRDTESATPVPANPYVVNAAIINTTWASSSLGTRDPDTFARQAGNNTVSNAGSWYGGKLAGTSSTSIVYEIGRTFGPGFPAMLGEVTPGRANLAASLGATSFRISEVGLNPSGPGENDLYQYLEIRNTGNAARSLAGYWLVVVDSFDGSANANDDEPGVGRILEEWDLTDMATGTNGLLLLGDNITPAFNPYKDLPSAASSFGDPVARNSTPAATGWGLGDLRFKDGCTIFLVQGYVPPVNKDLDGNNDGVQDAFFTGTIVDQIGFTQIGKTTIGKTYSTVDLRTVMPTDMVPDNLSRKPGNDTVSAAAWYGGNYPQDSPGFTIGFAPSNQVAGQTYGATWFGGYRGAGTPGLPNLSAQINPVSPPVPGNIRISEVMINPSNTETGRDDTNEYIELSSDNGAIAYMDQLWVVVVDLEGTVGLVRSSFSLSGYTTGLNGTALVGDNYDAANAYPYRNTDGPITPYTTAFDPPVAIGGNDFPNDGMALLLLRGPKGPLVVSADGQKVEGNLAGGAVLLNPSVYCDELVDSIVTSNVNPGAPYAWLDNNVFKVHHVSRAPGDFTANSAGAWHYGQIDQAGTPNAGGGIDPLLSYTSVFSGPFRSAGSPGRPNHAAAPGPVTAGSVVINEVHLNPPGADQNYEFVEFLDTSARARSLNGYYLVMIDNVVNNTGSVRHYWSLDGMATGSNGLFVLGNRYPLGGANNPWASVMRPQTAVGDPPGREGLSSSFSDAVLGAETDNTNVMLLLVRGFNRFIGFDTDTKDSLGLDSDGDGAFDFFPWNGGASGVLDSVMIRSHVATTPTPNPLPTAYPWNGWSYGLADLSGLYLSPPTRPFYHPESFARFNGDNAVNSPGSWYGGDLDNTTSANDGTITKYKTAVQDPTHPPFPAGFTGRATPGQPNLTRGTSDDADGDGASALVELALATNPSVAEVPYPSPAAGAVVVTNQPYGSFTYRRIRGGVVNADKSYGAEAYTYTVETSPDLSVWTSSGATIEQVGSPVANADGVTENVTFRMVNPATGAGARGYFRLRIGRR